MTQVANVRVNTSAPFPATVKGGGPVTISKQNGIWTVGFTIANLAAMPTGVNPATIDLLVWNTNTNVFQYVTMANLLAATGTPTNVTSAESPYTPLPSDTYLYVDTTGGPVVIDLDFAANRNGSALSIKDVKGNAATNSITVTPKAGETLDGYTNAAPLVLGANYDGIRISPNTASYVIDP
jgi:hypothetical protein